MPRTYLDAAAAAPLLPQAREAWLAALDDGWADPRRLHREGRRARLLLEGAREAIAEILGARTEEVAFTSSHTRAVHAAVLGGLRARSRVGGRVVASAVEHSAVLHAARFGAAEVDAVPVGPAGAVDPGRFADRVAQPGTALACLQSANGEVGTRQPVSAAADAARAAGVPLLVDAAASCGQDPLPADWDLLTADARGWGGPGGVGVLAIRAGTRWLSAEPADDSTERIPGGASVPAALAAAVALQVCAADLASAAEARRAQIDRIRAAAAAVPDTQVAGHPVDRLPHVVTFSCLYTSGEALVDELDAAGFAVGSGSACTASTLEPSHVLAAMGLLTQGNVRLGLPRGTPDSAIDDFIAALPGAVERVRQLLDAET